MRIALFTDSFRPTHDGVAHFVSALAEALGRQGHRVWVFAPLPPGAARHEHRGNLEIRRYRAVPLPYYPQYRWSLWPYTPAFRSSFASQVDVVHVQTPGPVGTAGVITAKHLGIPLVGSFHTNLRDMQKSLPDTWAVRNFFQAAWRWNSGVYARCDQVTTPAAAAKALLEESYVKSHLRAPIVVLPNGVDTERFRRGIREPDWGARLGVSGVPLLTFLGRLTRDKGVHTLLDAVKLMPSSPPFLVVIAGDGPERPLVEERLEKEPELRGRVRYLGTVREDEKPALLSQSRVFVLPSLADIAPITLLEAMASGALCVAAKEGGPAEMLEEGEAGLLVDARDPWDLATTLSRALGAGADEDGLSDRARRKVEEEFSIDRTARDLVALYEGVVRRRHGPPSPPALRG